MARVLICCGLEAERRLAAGLRRFGGGERAQVWCQDGLALYVEDEAGSPGAAGGADGVHGADSDSGITVEGGVVLAFEGFVTHRSERGAALRSVLVEDFLARGERCVASWRGSFRLVVAQHGVTRVYTDATGSRAVFAARDAFGPVYSSHVAPLLGVLPRVTVDGANILHFLRDGRFFAGDSLFREVRSLRPGRCRRVGAGIVGVDEEFAWFQYRLRPERVTARDVLPDLKRRLDEAVLGHWRRADAPALLLSGGYDSRYILNTLVQQVGPGGLTGLTACLWGEPSDDPDSDAGWAAREAGRSGVPFKFFPMRGRVAAWFGAAFAAQSGMTEHVVTHTDDLEWCRHLRESGHGSLFRGDEVFGPNGAEVRDVPEALAKVGVGSLPAELRWIDPAAPAEEWRAAHRERVAELGRVADDPNDVRDLLYFHERLPALQAHLNAQRAPYLENHNPLLDVDVLDLVSRLPRELRTDKRIFRLCFQEYFPTDGFATSGNAFDLGRLWRDAESARFVAERLEGIPAPFAERYFGPLAARFRGAAAGEAEPPSVAEIRDACRAIVLGHGLTEALGRRPTAGGSL